MGAHILFDPKIDRASQPCGLCLRPAPTCTLYLKKTKSSNTRQIDETQSVCSDLLPYNYGTANTSAKWSPSSNVPVQCPFCPAPAIWRYNFEYHIKERYQGASPSDYKDQWQLSETWVSWLKEVWKRRHGVPKTQGKKATTDLHISEAHSSRTAGRCAIQCIYIPLTIDQSI